MGCCGYGYFILGHFVDGHITQSMNKMLADRTPVKIAREDKMLPTFMRQGGQNADLIKTLYVSY